uniref:Uncharacterized protein n=1 Tax=Oryza glumipatula TaxID=40148 RepID=A0A0E0B0K6_9ORYZ
MAPRSFPAATVVVPHSAGASPRAVPDGAWVVCPSAEPAAVHARWSTTLLPAGAEVDHNPFAPYASALFDLWTPDSCSTPQLQCSMDTKFMWKNMYMRYSSNNFIFK